MERRFESCFHRFDHLSALLDPLHQRPQRQPRPRQIGEQVTHAGIGHKRHELLRHQIHHERAQVRPVLRPAGSLLRKRARRHLLAGRAAHTQRLVLRDPQTDQRQILHLSPLARHDLRPRLQRCLTCGADRRMMLDDGVRFGHQMQRLTPVTELPARLLARLVAQAARAGQLALQPVGGRRFAAVVTVLGESCLQVTHLLHQRGDLLTLLGDHGFKLGDACVWRHASMLHLFRKSA